MNYFQKYQHVVPLNDLKQHKVVTNINANGYVFCDCECQPEHIELENGGLVIVHHSFDGREGIEIVNEILK